MRASFLGTVCGLLLTQAALAQSPDAPVNGGEYEEIQPLKVAISGFTGVNVPPELLSFYTEHFAQKLTESGVKVTTPAQIQALIGMERQKQLVGCSDESSSCMTELVNALGVDGLARGEIAHLGDTWRVTLKIIGAVNGEVVTSASAKAFKEDEVADQLSKSAFQMAPLAAKRLNKPLRKPGEPALRRLKAKPQGQVAANGAQTQTPPQQQQVSTTKTAALPARHWPLALIGVGGVSILVGGASALLVTGANANLTSRSESYARTFHEAKNTWDLGNGLETVGWIGLLGGTALTVTGFALYRGESQVVTVSMAPGARGGGVVAFGGTLP